MAWISSTHINPNPWASSLSICCNMCSHLSIPQINLVYMVSYGVLFLDPNPFCSKSCKASLNRQFDTPIVVIPFLIVRLYVCVCVLWA
jgi:hypothetical protein